MLEKLNGCYQRLQTLEITPTLSNMEKLVQTLYDIKDVYDELKKAKKEGEDVARQAVDSQRADNH